MLQNASHIVIQGGTFNSFNSPTSGTSKGMDLLMEWVATGAFHNSKELYDAPKCHPHTRVAVLDDIMQWVNESESTREDFMLWLFGPAGAGKSAIAKKIAEIAAKMDMLIATFFFSRTSPTRSTEDRLNATLAYQLAISVPETRYYIEAAIERDRFIFNKDIPTQIDALIIRPLQSTQITSSKKLIIIDGLDECNDRNAQLTILEAISRFLPQHKLPIIFLVASRPETDLVTLFNHNEPLRSIHHRMALDDTYQPDDDIRFFFSDKFQQIRRTHPLRSTIPNPWPTQELLDRLVKKSSGQFVYASTVVKFVESTCHRPTSRLNIILGVSPPGNTNPFAQLDALYNHLLSSVDDIQLTLRVLSLYCMAPDFAYTLRVSDSVSPELFLSLEPGDIQLALVNLSSIVAYNELSGRVNVLHASFVDFLSDKRRSTIYYMDKADTCTKFVRHILQCVNEPDGMRAGNIIMFGGLDILSPWILKAQLRNDILNFDLDALYSASIRARYRETRFSKWPKSVMIIFCIWNKFLNDVGLEDEDDKEVLDRLNKSLRWRFQIYHSDWQLQLLVPLALANAAPANDYYDASGCRYFDILLGLDDHDIHIADQNALDLRHVNDQRELVGLMSFYLDGDAYASAALHCMRFLSNPPKCSVKNECPGMGLVYPEWRETCVFTHGLLRTILKLANTSPELVQFISNQDIDPAVQKVLSADRIWELNVYILAFLGRTNVCSNWRIISAVQKSLTEACNARTNRDQWWTAIDWDHQWLPAIDHQSTLEENDANCEGDKIIVPIRQWLDECCARAHSY